MSRKIAPLFLAVTIALVLILSGCNLFSTNPPSKHVAGEIPGSGGEIQDQGKTAEYTFSPDKTGMWIVTFMPSGDVADAYLSIFDLNDDSAPLEPVHNEIDYYAFLLDSGNTYKISIELFLFTVGTDNSFFLSVAQPVEIPGGGGDKPASGFSSLFSFTPDKSGEWSFHALDIDDSARASIGVRNFDFSFIAFDTVYLIDGVEDKTVTVPVDLDAGTEYLVDITLDRWSASCKLSVSFIDIT